VQLAFLALLIAAVFSLFSTSLQQRLQAVLHGRPALIWIAPPLFAAIFAVASALANALSIRLIGMVLAYTAAPVLCVYLQGPGFPKKPTVLDFAAILLIWLPIEFAAGAPLVPIHARGFLHSVAYGIAILLGLVLFIGYRTFDGLKYNLPRARRDLWQPFAAFAITAPVLATLGVAIGFIPAPHWPVQPAGKMAAAVAIIFAGTAVPEEILFRSLIQNFLMLRFGATTRTLLLASFIFGCAHLDNGPQPLPNWRYMILATVAGVAYGKVFQKSSTVLSSAALHTMVDWTKHFYF
jgi:membrane protease YdiL (CAAX protease family)